MRAAIQLDIYKEFLRVKKNYYIVKQQYNNLLRAAEEIDLRNFKNKIRCYFIKRHLSNIFAKYTAARELYESYQLWLNAFANKKIK
jgi:hypothetical protein